MKEIISTSSTQLYFDKFQYCAHLPLTGAFLLRPWSGKTWANSVVAPNYKILSRLRRKIDWDDRWAVATKFLSSHTHTQLTLISKNENFKSVRTKENLLTCAALLKKLNKKLGDKEKVRFVFTEYKVLVYTNSFDILKTISRTKLFKIRAEFHQVNVEFEKGTLPQKNPKFKYRTYLKNTRVTPPEKATLRKFFERNKQLNLSSATKRWIGDEERSYVYSTYFFDYNDDKELLMLNLVLAKVIGKTLTFVNSTK